MPDRIQLRRTKGWRKPEGAIVVARPSRWGNPWTVGALIVVYVPLSGGHDSYGITAELAVALYRCHLRTRSVDLEPLRGHDLACWCPLDQPCHADVLLEVANA